MSTVHSLLLGYPSLLDIVCPLLLGRNLSVCYLVCVHQLLVNVYPCVIGWFMSSVHPLLQGILNNWIHFVHYIVGLLYPETTVHTAYLEYRNWQHISVHYILGMLDDILSSIG